MFRDSPHSLLCFTLIFLWYTVLVVLLAEVYESTQWFYIWLFHLGTSLLKTPLYLLIFILFTEFRFKVDFFYSCIFSYFFHPLTKTSKSSQKYCQLKAYAISMIFNTFHLALTYYLKFYLPEMSWCHCKIDYIFRPYFLLLL